MAAHNPFAWDPTARLERMDANVVQEEQRQRAGGQHVVDRQVDQVAAEQVEAAQFSGEQASYLWLPGHDPLLLNPLPSWPT